MSYIGIDYGNGKVNLDEKTGIRYGVFRSHDMADWFWDEIEAIYPSCEEKDCIDNDQCQCDCGYTPISWQYSGEGIEIESSDGVDFFCTKSTHYTRGVFCSPCAPGAVTIGRYAEEGPRCYCPPADWFRDDLQVEVKPLQ